MFTNWIFHHPRMTISHLGYIPSFLSLDDPRPAREQIATTYIGGWHHFHGFTLRHDNSLTYPSDPLTYPSDPPMRPLASAQFRDELLVFYPHAWFAIIQPDRSFEIARLD